MIKKIVLAALFVLFLNGCNYQPIYSSKNVKLLSKDELKEIILNEKIL